MAGGHDEGHRFLNRGAYCRGAQDPDARQGIQLERGRLLKPLHGILTHSPSDQQFIRRGHQASRAERDVTIQVASCSVYATREGFGSYLHPLCGIFMNWLLSLSPRARPYWPATTH